MPLARNDALLIGIEDYPDSPLQGARYARADVEAMREALVGLGFPAEGVTVLLDERATKTTIEHHLDRRLRDLKADDSFLLFFAGHGYSIGGESYIAGRDTQHADLSQTGINLGDVVRRLKKSKFLRIQIYLACCHEEIAIDGAKRPSVGGSSLADLDRDSKGLGHVACFSACGPGESSYASDRLKRGIWAYHLAEALSGEVPAILSADGRLVAGALQSHLARSVETTLREEFTDRRKQTPRMSASPSLDFEVADLSAVLQGKSKVPAVQPNKIKDFSFSNHQYVSIKKLHGYQKFHKVPTRYGHDTRSLVVNLAQGDMTQDLARIHSLIQDNMDYSRKELRVTNPEGTDSGSIWTPDFQYSVRAEQLEDEPSEALISGSLSDVREEAVLNSRGFRAIFDALFDTISLTFARPIDIIALIDRIEARKGTGVRVKYPPDFAHCEIRVEGCAEFIHVENNRFELKLANKQPLQALVDAFQRMMQATQEAGIDDHLALPGPQCRS